MLQAEDNASSKNAGPVWKKVAAQLGAVSVKDVRAKYRKYILPLLAPRTAFNSSDEEC